MNICKICGKKFKANKKTIKCCSDLCRKIAKEQYDFTKNKECICKICGNNFLSSRSHSKYCSDFCRKYQSHISKNCIICNKVFLGKKQTLTCSRECNTKYRNSKNIKILTCSYCKKEFKRANNYIFSKNNFCSSKCSNYHHLESRNLNKNKYSKNWYKIRLEVLRYYNYKCLICCQDDGHLNVHHTIPRKFFKNKNLADNFEYLIPLCNKCHKKIHKDNDLWFDTNFTNIENNLLKKDIV